MSLSIAVSIPINLATSIHASPDPETGSLDQSTQQSILRSIVTAIKSLPADSSTWGLEPSPSLEEISEQEEEDQQQSRSSASPPEARVSFSETDTFIPSVAARTTNSVRKRRSSLKNGASYTPPVTALQKPSGPDISFPAAQFVFEIRQGYTRSIAVAAHGNVTTAELALAIWKREGIPMREQRLYLGHDELYNGEAHERDGVYELMRLRGKFRQVRQGSVVVLLVGHGKRSPRMGLGL